VRIAGERISRRPEEERASMRARSLGLLFQQDNLAGHLTVAQNVAVAQSLTKTARRGSNRSNVLERLGIAARANHLPRQLSGGEQARAGLAVATANDPDVILADEPTGELDDSTTARIIALLRDQAGRGAAVLVVTHDPAVAGAADRELRLRDGRLEA
jgi:putative ABC transport system ATP-binding protein